MIRRSPKKSAQAMIELALLAPIFFLMLSGVFDFARAAAVYTSLSNVTREGGREAIIASYAGTVSNDAAVVGQVQTFAIGVPLSPATCIHGWTASPAIHMPTTANTGWVYILAGTATAGAANAPAGQASGSAGAGCVSHIPAGAGTYPLKIEVVYNFVPITPFAAQFMGSTGFMMVVTSTMYTEF
jgi:hypothetical protein